MKIVVWLVVVMVAVVVETATAIAALFTDEQWADLQHGINSLLNFVLLVWVAYTQRNIKAQAELIRLEAPVEAARETKERFVHDIQDGDDDLREALAEVVADALGKRRRRVDR